MEKLIRQVFLHVDVIGPHVHEGHYDLLGPDGEIILPQVWETMVQPDWKITMHMRPMPDPPSPPPQPTKANGKTKDKNRKSARHSHPMGMIDPMPPIPSPPPPPPPSLPDIPEKGQKLIMGLSIIVERRLSN